jgi:hypothetical protein
MIKTGCLLLAVYPFGMLMPDRYVSDTSSKCMTLTQSRWVTTWVDSCYSIIDLIGGQNNTGGAIARDTLGNYLLIEATRVGSSVSFAMMVEPGVEQEMAFDIAYVNSGTGSLLAIEDSVAGVWKTLNSVPLDTRGNIRLPFVSLLGNVRVSVTGPTQTLLNRICRKKPVQYQESYLTQVCNGDKDRYRFGFNGQEKVNEIAGVGNHNTAEFWEYDTRVARRWNLDPRFKEIPNQSPYSINHSNPVVNTDKNGDIGIVGALIGGGIGAVASLTKSVIQDGWGSLKDGKTWAKAGVNAAAGAIVGATGGMAAGLVATATTSFGASLAEDVIDDKKLDFKKAAVSSLVATATFGLAKYGTDKLSKAVTKSWWRRGYKDPFGNYTKGNTNALMRHLGKNAGTNAAQLVERAADATNLTEGLIIDKLFPGEKNSTELPGVTVYPERESNGEYKLSDSEINRASNEVKSQIENNSNQNTGSNTQ